RRPPFFATRQATSAMPLRSAVRPQRKACWFYGRARKERSCYAFHGSLDPGFARTTAFAGMAISQMPLMLRSHPFAGRNNRRTHGGDQKRERRRCRKIRSGLRDKAVESPRQDG